MRASIHARTAMAACVLSLAVLVPAAPASAGFAFGERALESGMRGDDVAKLQTLLTEFGFDTRRTGDFGRGTERSVKQYERSREMKADGVVRKVEARRMLRRYRRIRDEEPAEPEPPRFGDRRLRLGKRGPDVERLQRLLTRMEIRTDDDGNFGPATETSVKRYERWREMRVNGEVSRGEAPALERRAKRGAEIPEPEAPDGDGHAFPVRGPYSFGGDGSRFGAPRNGRTHKGQDIAAAAGTRLVSVHRGVVSTRAYQAGGAGNYLVIRGNDGSDSVYMHLQAPAVVAPGERVSAGQTIGAVGNTGASYGAHLHFELWTPHWFAGGEAYDPLPKLRRWADG